VLLVPEDLPEQLAKKDGHAAGFTNWLMFQRRDHWVRVLEFGPWVCSVEPVAWFARHEMRERKNSAATLVRASSWCLAYLCDRPGRCGSISCVVIAHDAAIGIRDRKCSRSEKEVDDDPA